METLKQRLSVGALVVVFLITAFFAMTGFRALKIIKNQGQQQLKLSQHDSIAQVAGEKVAGDSEAVCDCERQFKEPVPIELQGQVIATFVSGADFGLRTNEKVAGYQAFYILGQGEDYSGLNSKNIKLSGSLVGVTCAYRETVFKECAAEVVVQQIDIID